MRVLNLDKELVIKEKWKCSYYCQREFDNGSSMADIDLSNNGFVCKDCYQIILEEIENRNSVQYYTNGLEDAERAAESCRKSLKLATDKMNKFNEKQKANSNL